MSDAIDARSKAEENYEKYRKLFEQGAVSQQELASLESELEKADGQLALAQLDLEMIENPDKTEIEIKQLLLQETRASLAQVHEKIQKTIVRAQRDGIVLQNAVKPGMVVTPGSAVMVIGDPLDLEIVFEVNEYDFPKLAIGQRAMITGEAFYGYTYEGEVVKIAPTAIQTQTNRGSETRVSATLKILNPDEKIKPGFSATVDIIVEEREGALTLPLESVIEENGIHKVFVMEDGDPMEKVIKTGIRNELFVEILEGLIVGIRKALGAQERDIMIQFLIESMVLSVMGGLLGMILGIGAFTGMARLINIPAVISGKMILLALGFSAGVGICFGVYPARKAAYQDPIEALRYE